MKSIVVSLSCAALVALVVTMASAASQEVKGILIDKACSTKATSQTGAAAQKVATTHDRECALMPSCQMSGYGVFTADNKYLTFDDAGNKKAIAALKKSKKADNLSVTVNGDVQGDSIKVASLKLE
jgi:hypothetical protein